MEESKLVQNMKAANPKFYNFWKNKYHPDVIVKQETPQVEDAADRFQKYLDDNDPVGIEKAENEPLPTA